MPNFFWVMNSSRFFVRSMVGLVVMNGFDTKFVMTQDFDLVTGPKLVLGSTGVINY